jgi:hypothetical protein
LKGGSIEGWVLINPESRNPGLGFLFQMLYKMGVVGGREVVPGRISNHNHKWIDRRVTSPGVGEVGFTFFPIIRALS